MPNCFFILRLRFDAYDNNGNERRLSNGPMEGYNRTPKDFKRNSRGLSNFEYARSRLIWANRKNESILAIPKS